MGKTEKTNAMRQLDKLGVPYETLAYPSDGGAVDAVTVAALLSVPPETVYKTLVLQGSDSLFYVCVIPGPEELDLKKAAAAFGVKNLRMLHVDEIRPATGYVRGGCSPIGMKKQYRTAVDSAALGLTSVLVSAGQIGLQIRIMPARLLTVCKGIQAALCRDS